MVVLSDRDIKKALESGRLAIENLNKDYISVASIDLKLGNRFRIFKHSAITHIDTKKEFDEKLMELIEIPENKPFIIHPGDLVLANTIEYIKMPNDLVARLDGRSSFGRLGIVVHSTAGSVDPGFEGQLTLEIANISKVPVCLWPGTRICRLTFDELSSPSEMPYNKRKGSKYIGQREPIVSKIAFDKD